MKKNIRNRCWYCWNNICYHLAYCDRCCDVDSSDNFLFEEKKVK